MPTNPYSVVCSKKSNRPIGIFLILNFFNYKKKNLKRKGNKESKEYEAAVERGQERVPYTISETLKSQIQSNLSQISLFKILKKKKKAKAVRTVSTEKAIRIKDSSLV